jgi:hypothetical protein
VKQLPPPEISKPPSACHDAARTEARPFRSCIHHWLNAPDAPTLVPTPNKRSASRWADLALDLLPLIKRHAADSAP